MEGCLRVDDNGLCCVRCHRTKQKMSAMLVFFLDVIFATVKPSNLARDRLHTALVRICSYQFGSTGRIGQSAAFFCLRKNLADVAPLKHNKSSVSSGRLNGTH